jgi:hypothetical protein
MLSWETKVYCLNESHLSTRTGCAWMDATQKEASGPPKGQVCSLRQSKLQDCHKGQSSVHKGGPSIKTKDQTSSLYPKGRMREHKGAEHREGVEWMTLGPGVKQGERGAPPNNENTD